MNDVHSAGISSSAAVARRVSAGEFDVGFIETPCDTPGIAIATQGADELIGIVGPHHPLAASGRATAERFCREPFVVRDTGSETKSYVERALMAKGLMIQPVMSLGSTEAIKRAVSVGIGVAIVSRLSIGLELQAQTLAAVHLMDMRIRRPLYRITPANRKQSAALTAFLQILPDLHQASSAAISAKRGLRSK